MSELPICDRDTLALVVLYFSRMGKVSFSVWLTSSGDDATKVEPFGVWSTMTGSPRDWQFEAQVSTPQPNPASPPSLSKIKYT